MVTIVFDASEMGPETIASAPPGERVLDVCDAAHAPVELSCRAANCGICRVIVIEGADLLDAPSPEERAVLDAYRSPPSARLACQAKIAGGRAGSLIRLRWSRPSST